MTAPRFHDQVRAIAAAVGWYFLLANGLAQAQTPGCRCTFKEAPWEAYGTKAACTTITRKGGTSCEIEFGGISADPKAVARVRGVNASEYSRQVYDVLGTFLQYLRDNKREALADPKFLSTAIPIFMRGVYFRPPLDDNGMSRAKDLDYAITGFLEKYSNEVGKLFLEGGPEMKVSMYGATFTVGKGYITVDHPLGFIITRYMPAE